MSQPCGCGTGPRCRPHRIQARYEEIQELKALDVGIKPIQRELGISRNLVRKYYYATSLEELLASPPKKAIKLNAACLDCGEPFTQPKRYPRCFGCGAKSRRITAMHDELAEAQNSLFACCAICGAVSSGTRDGKPIKLNVDHCHSTGNIRGLLCGPCNRLLGCLKDDRALFRAARAYLRKPRNQAALPSGVSASTNHATFEEPNSHLSPRDVEILQWRVEGVTFKEIGRRIGVSKQRAVQLIQRIQSGQPTHQACWCGEPIVRSTGPGRPRSAYCSPEHERRFGNPQYHSEAHHAQMLAAQKNLCAICKSPETTRYGQGEGGIRALAVDHCHTTGTIRGLLCSKCNVGLGLAGDDPARLLAAERYLKKHQSAA